MHGRSVLIVSHAMTPCHQPHRSISPIGRYEGFWPSSRGHSRALRRFRSPQNRRSRPIRSYRALEDLAFAYAGLGRKTEAIRYPGVSPCPGNRQGHLTSVSLASIEVETSGNCKLQSGAGSYSLRFCSMPTRWRTSRTRRPFGGCSRAGGCSIRRR